MTANDGSVLDYTPDRHDVIASIGAASALMYSII